MLWMFYFKLGRVYHVKTIHLRCNSWFFSPALLALATGAFVLAGVFGPIFVTSFLPLKPIRSAHYVVLVNNIEKIKYHNRARL